jgi:tRNA A-37 threonylcarbamoyl transferase component Bud32
MKIDMSPEAIAKRLKVVNELRRTCLSLANSSAGKDNIEKIFKKQIGTTDITVTNSIVSRNGKIFIDYTSKELSENHDVK